MLSPDPLGCFRVTHNMYIVCSSLTARTAHIYLCLVFLKIPQLLCFCWLKCLEEPFRIYWSVCFTEYEVQRETKAVFFPLLCCTSAQEGGGQIQANLGFLQNPWHREISQDFPRPSRFPHGTRVRQDVEVTATLRLVLFPLEPFAIFPLKFQKLSASISINQHRSHQSGGTCFDFCVDCIISIKKGLL